MSLQSRTIRCANCGTIRQRLRARQLCGRCYYAQRKLEQADENIDPNFVKGYKEECRRRLRVLQVVEQKRGGPISGLDIENELRWVARKAGARGSLFKGSASYIASHFGPEQRKVLYGLLSQVWGNTPWAIDWHNIVSNSIQK
jgi:ribosomal protein S27AE